MAKRRSPFSEEIFNEWNQLVLDKGERVPADEKRNRARRLYDRCYVDGSWHVEPHDASIVSSLLAHLSWEDKEFSQVECLCRRALAHPDIDTAMVEKTHFLTMSGGAMLCQGRLEEGVEALTYPLEEGFWSRRIDRRSYLLSLRLYVGAALHELGTEEPSSEPLRALTERVIAEFRGCLRLSRQARHATSVKELLELLDSTFPGR